MQKPTRPGTSPDRVTQSQNRLAISWIEPLHVLPWLGASAVSKTLHAGPLDCVPERSWSAHLDRDQTPHGWNPTQITDSRQECWPGSGTFNHLPKTLCERNSSCAERVKVLDRDERGKQVTVSA
jgi:hypothetical protein